MPALTCAQCGVLFHIPLSAVRVINFCSRVCYENSRKVLIRCSQCGSIIKLRKRDLHMRRVRSKSGILFCSDICQKKWLKTIHKKGRPRKERRCLLCGTLFHSSHPKLYCSEDCSRKSLSLKRRGLDNPNWVEKVEVTCEKCGKTFESYKSSKRKFCSKDCWFASWKITPENRIKMLKALHIRPTKPERRLAEIIRLNDLPFKYVGNGSFLIGKLNPDFVSTNHVRKVIEFFGDFWHRNDSHLNGNYRTEEVRREYFKAKAYAMMVIRNEDFQDEVNLIHEIRIFSEK